MFILGWLFFSVAAGMFAYHRRNRSGGGWFVVALLFTPLVAFVLLAILPSGAPRLAIEQAAHQQNFRETVNSLAIGVVIVLVLVTGWLVLTP